MNDAFPLDRQPALRVVPMPADTNASGDIFGGWIMSHVDIAGSIPAMQRARGRVVTVAVNAFTFKKPVYVADVVSFYAEVVRVGATSITVEVKVYAQRSSRAPVPGEVVLVTDATLTYVCLGLDGKKRAVPAD
jgi:acyl-CoA thioesterase YciA